MSRRWWADRKKALLFKTCGFIPCLWFPDCCNRVPHRSGMGVAHENIADKLGKAMDKTIAPRRVATRR